MKAVVWRGVGDIAVENVDDPKLEQPRDAVVRLTRSAICGTDLHFYRGTVFGGPRNSGPFYGMQAEAVRVPFANIGPVKLPDNVTDDQAIILSDIGPTGYFGAKLAGVQIRKH